MAKAWSDRLTTAVNVLVIGMVGYLAVGPDGWITSRIEDHLAKRERTQTLASAWDDLSGRSTTIDGSERLVVFIDYMCPGCEGAHFRWAEELHQRGVSVQYRHIPRPGAEPGARAAVCAEGDPAFDAVQDLLYTTSGWEDPGFGWRDFAVSAGLEDVDGFVRCLASPNTNQRLVRDEEWAARLGLRATPTFIGRAEMVVGVPSEAEMERLVGR